MAFLVCVFLGIGLSGESVLPFNPVLQHPDLLDHALDRIAMSRYQPIQARNQLPTVPEPINSPHQGLILWSHVR